MRALPTPAAVPRTPVDSWWRFGAVDRSFGIPYSQFHSFRLAAGNDCERTMAETEATEPDPFAKWLDLVEAARELNMHPQSVRRLIKQGQLPAHFRWGKYLIDRNTLDVFKTNYDPRPGRKRSAKLL